ncbi:group XIIA secretory phospholipase A2-like [Centruroides sculpturatus]|uniref:group XIIA secretory phospholipase A2-like n=1 Tax=Centruroides sculpturatus TaxID=218467 RepID=UPI000C6E25CB|nr:group XIIA secretory phospholipase A2-like [Centruroides sculpturatus]
MNMNINRLISTKGLLCILSMCLLSCLRSETVIQGVKELLDGISSVMDDVSFGVKQVRQSLDAVEEVVKYSQGKPCEYQCPPGKRLKRNKNYNPVPQGCGSYGIQVILNLPLLKDVHKCCDKHDICYGTCMSSKFKCDSEFEKCLYNKCEKQAKHLKDDVRKCTGISKLFHMGVQALGCKAFLDSQAEACICSEHDEL